MTAILWCWMKTDGLRCAQEMGWTFYVFAYGNDCKEALNDFYRLTGKTPMLPRYALGNWWSRYYAYTEDSYKALVTRFEKIPFSVGVLDMDWHLVEEVDPNSGSWTGYTWNKSTIRIRSVL